MGHLQAHQRRSGRAPAPPPIPSKPPSTRHISSCYIFLPSTNPRTQLYLVSAKLCVCATPSFLSIYGFVELRPTQPEFAVTMLLVPIVVFKPLLAVYCIKREAAAGTAAVIVSVDRGLPPFPPAHTTH